MTNVVKTIVPIMKRKKIYKRPLFFIALGLLLALGIKTMVTKPTQVKADTLLKMDEGYGSSVRDINGNVTAGTITGAVWKTNDFCFDENCLYFDGNGDLVNFGDHANLDFADTDSFTISGWFRHGPISAMEVLVGKLNTTDNDGGYQVQMETTGNLTCLLEDNDADTTTDDTISSTAGTYADNKWHYFTCVKSTTTSLKLYIDGGMVAEKTTLASTTTLANNDTFYIGMAGDGASNDYHGFLDEIKVYRSARTAAEIKADFLGATPSRGTSVAFGPSNNKSWVSDGLVGYWNMDEAAVAPDCTNGQILDYSGNGNNMVLCPATTGPTGGNNGKFGHGITFDFTNDYAYANPNDSLDMSGPFTISTWVKPAGASNDYARFVNMDQATNGYFFGGGAGSGRDLSVWMDGASVVDTDEILTDNVWQLATAVFDGTTVTIYLNGAAVRSGTFTGTLAPNNDYLIVGGQAGGQRYNGTMDELRVYKRALTAVEVQSLYTSWAPGPVGHWQMNENNGSTTNDISGYNATLAFTNSPVWNSGGKYGSGITMNGTDSYLINATDQNQLDMRKGGFSAFAWVNATASGSDDLLFFKGGGSSTDTGYDFGLDNGTGSVQVSISDGTSYLADSLKGTSNVFGGWHYVGFTWDPTVGVKLYVDGILETSSAITSTVDFDSNDELRVGGYTSSTLTIKGTLDEAKVYNYARTGAQIIEDMNAGHPSPGSPFGSAVAHWKLDDGYNTTAQDASENNLDLTLSAASWTNNSKSGKAWNGDGAKWMSITDSATADNLDFAANEDFTISMWFKSDSAVNPTSTEYLLSKAETSPGYRIWANSDFIKDEEGTVSFGTDDDTSWTPGDEVISTTDVYDTTWHLITAVKQGTTKIELYIDGILEDAKTALQETGTLVNSINFYLGDRNGVNGGDELFGDLDEVRIFRSALTADQIKLLYNQGFSAVMGAPSTDSSGNYSFSAQSDYCPPGNTETNCAVGLDPTPIGEWKFDENAGTGTVIDTSTNGRTGAMDPTMTSSVWVPGKIGSAIDFDGVDDAIDITDSDAFNPAAMTVEAWFNIDVVPPAGTVDVIWNHRDGDGVPCFNAFAAYVDENATLVTYYYNDSGANQTIATPASTISPGVWYHIASVWDGSNVYFYLNGALVSPAEALAGGTVCDASGTVTIGVRNGSTSPFQGKIDEVRIFNYARTQTQVAWDYSKGGPQLWYKFDECTGNIAYNSAPNSNGTYSTINGTINPVSSGNTATGTCSSGTSTHMWNDGTNGKFNGSIGLDNTDDYINIPSPALPTGDFTYMAWFISNGTSDTLISSSNSSDQDELRIRKDSTNTVEVATNNTVRLNSGTVLNTGTWYHITVVKSGTTITTYTNGVADGTATDSSGVLDFDACDLIIGADNSSGDVTPGCTGELTNFFDGQIDDVRVYNYALSPAQIRSAANAGASVRF